MRGRSGIDVKNDSLLKFGQWDSFERTEKGTIASQFLIYPSEHIVSSYKSTMQIRVQITHSGMCGKLVSEQM